MGNQPKLQRPINNPTTPLLCFFCCAKIKAAVESGAIEPSQAVAAFAVTWCPVITTAGAASVPTCADCMPLSISMDANALDTTTKIPEGLLKAGRNG